MNSEAMFAAIDRLDANAWAEYLSEDATMRFGNAEEVHGRQGCRDALAAFYDTIDGVSHSILGKWEDLEGGASVFQSDVTYTLKDGREETVPVVTVTRAGSDGLLDDYRVYIDLAPVLA